MTKKIDRRGRGLRSKAVGRTQRVAVFSCILCVLCGFSESPFQKITKSLECGMIGVATRVDMR